LASQNALVGVAVIHNADFAILNKAA